MYLILLIYSQHNGQDGKRKSTHSLESIRKPYSVINTLLDEEKGIIREE